MQKLILLFLLLPFLLGGTTYISDQGTRASVSYSTVANSTLYVRTTGDDTNSCLTSGSPCLTINGAINKIPFVIGHDTTVDVGPGNFAEYALTGRVIQTGATLKVTGTLAAPTLTTGTASGTATGGSNYQMIDSGQAWTVGDLEGHYLLIGGYYKLIYSNDATTIDVISSFGGALTGLAYEIVEPTSVINSGAAWSSWINISGLVGAGGYWDVSNFSVPSSTGYGVNVVHSGNGSLSRIRVTAPDVHGVAVASVTSITLDGIYVYNATYMGITVNNVGTVNRLDVLVDDSAWSGISLLSVEHVAGMSSLSTSNGESGFDLINCGYVNGDQIIANSNTLDGVTARSVRWLDWDVGSAESNTNHGVDIDSATQDGYGGSVVNLGTVSVASNGSGGVRAQNRSTLFMSTVTGGSNTGYGAETLRDSTIFFKVATTVAGSVADLTVDGSTSLDWATDFAVNGDVQLNANWGSRVERKD